MQSLYHTTSACEVFQNNDQNINKNKNIYTYFKLDFNNESDNHCSIFGIMLNINHKDNPEKYTFVFLKRFKIELNFLYGKIINFYNICFVLLQNNMCNWGGN